MTFTALSLAAVSTPDQAADDRESIPYQLSTNRAAIEREGWRLYGELILPGMSRDYDWLHQIMAASPEYRRLVELIENEKINLIVVRHYDRVWRTDGLRADMMRMCREHGVQVYSTSQPKPPVPPEELPRRRAGLSAIMETLSGALSEEEQNIRVARQRTGMAGRIKRGLHHAGYRIPYGYRRGPDGVYQIEPEEAHWVKWAVEQVLAGRGVAQVCGDLTRRGIPSPGAETAPGAPWYPRTLRRLLSNSFYAGIAHWGPFINEQSAHEALISEADWIRLSETLKTRARRTASTLGDANWLVGILRCGYCGWVMSYYRHKNRGGVEIYLRCSQYTASVATRCQSNGHTSERVHAAVLAEMIRLLSDPEEWARERAQGRQEPQRRAQLAAVEKALTDNATQYERWSHAYQVGAIPLEELIARRKQLTAEREAWETERGELKRLLADDALARETIEELSMGVDALAYADDSHKRIIARALFRSVRVRRDGPPQYELW